MAATEVMEATEEMAAQAEEAQAEETEAPVSFPPIRDDEENANTIDVDIENMVWEVEDAPENNQSAADEVIAEEPQYDDYAYNNGYEKRIARAYNKHLFTWVFSFFCGIYGVDRFVRGQIALGVLKLATFGGFGIWYLVDLMIALTKSYLGEYSEEDDLYFDRYGRYI